MTTLTENTGLQFSLSPIRRDPPSVRGMHLLQEALAVLAALAILLAFFHVVQGSVLQGERLRAAMAQHSAAAYQCNSLTSTSEASTCLQQLRALTTVGHSQMRVLVSAATQLK